MKKEKRKRSRHRKKENPPKRWPERRKGKRISPRALFISTRLLTTRSSRLPITRGMSSLGRALEPGVSRGHARERRLQLNRRQTMQRKKLWIMECAVFRFLFADRGRGGNRRSGPSRDRKSGV